MSGLTNNTARQFNLKCVAKDGSRITVRVAPGFNVVEDHIWEHFVPKSGKDVDPYVAELKRQGHLNFGAAVDDMELDTESSTKVKSKIVRKPAPLDN